MTTEFTPTHAIYCSGEIILVEAVEADDPADGVALYTEDEARAYVASDWSFDAHGYLLWQGGTCYPGGGTVTFRRLKGADR